MRRPATVCNGVALTAWAKLVLLLLTRRGCKVRLQIQQAFEHSLASFSFPRASREPAKELKINRPRIVLQLTALLEQFTI